MGYYKKIGKTLEYHSEDSSDVISCDKLGMIVDKSSGTMLKHGSYYNVEARFIAIQDSYRTHGMPDMADDIVLLDVSDVDIEEINKCLSITGYAKKVYDRFTEAKD